jgi:lipopolysaccharide/colanic/teichoic acid biosynthesis glycosyltransferase
MMKRVMDVVGAVLLLVLTSPVLLWAYWAIRRDSPGGSVFRQIRIGQGGRPFVLYKFRTMVLGADAEWTPPAAQQLSQYVFQPPSQSSITPLGQFLRETSIDELPQLLNVLKGDMSLVGPRPEIPEMVALYTPDMHKRHVMRPGMTGLAQVMGRNMLTVGQTLAYDLEYCERWTLALDLWIMARTVGLVWVGLWRRQT